LLVGQVTPTSQSRPRLPSFAETRHWAIASVLAFNDALAFNERRKPVFRER
jgi:hypothetical protein